MYGRSTLYNFRSKISIFSSDKWCVYRNGRGNKEVVRFVRNISNGKARIVEGKATND
jgi:hypothetical protein